MKKYIKPTVEVVNLKSSNDIAASTTFKQLRENFISSYTLSSNEYAITQYSNGVSGIVTEG